MGGWAVRGERGPREEKGWGEMRVGYREGVGRAGGEKGPSPLRGTPGSSLRSPAEGEG